MVGTYAYSLDGQRYVGSFETRQQALTVGLDAARQRQTPPETVYVGRHIPADPKASGHARMILSNMAARVGAKSGSSQRAKRLLAWRMSAAGAPRQTM